MANNFHNKFNWHNGKNTFNSHWRREREKKKTEKEWVRFEFATNIHVIENKRLCWCMQRNKFYSILFQGWKPGFYWIIIALYLQNIEMIVMSFYRCYFNFSFYFVFILSTKNLFIFHHLLSFANDMTAFSIIHPSNLTTKTAKSTFQRWLCHRKKQSESNQIRRKNMTNKLTQTF